MKMKDVHNIMVDFKDKLEISIEDFSSYSSIKKWIIYDYLHACRNQCDADKPIRDYQVFADLGWDNPELIDAMFPLRMILTGLICAFPTKYASVKRGKRNYKIQDIIKKEDFGVFDLLDKGRIEECIGKVKKVEDEEIKEWSKRFQTALGSYAKNVHTIGNYMPCPDNGYNKTKGWSSGRWKYNDRLDVLYRSIISDKNHNWFIWFENNQKKLYLEDILCQCKTAPELLNLTVQKRAKFDEKQICNLIEWLEMVNTLIDSRGKIIIEQYKKIIS